MHIRRRATLFTALIALALAGCSDGSSANDSGGTAGAAGSTGSEVLWPTGGWDVQTPEEQGMDSNVLEGTYDYAFAPAKNTQAVVVVRRGALVAEWYNGRADSWVTSWSMAKSHASALIGIAIDEGLIPGVDVKLAEYYPDWVGTEKEAITLRHVLQMASGLDFVEDYDPNALESSDIIRIVLAEPDQLEFSKNLPKLVEPGTRFNYSSGDSMLLSGVIEQATGMTVAEYAQKKLFSRIGYDKVEWWRDVTVHAFDRVDPVRGSNDGGGVA